jgi:saccharopine dehydrogenase-like NADP-dependent oxidoreductase
LIRVFEKYDIVLNCLEYTLNAGIVDACLIAKVSYIDLGDTYAGILRSYELGEKFKANGTFCCLWAGSAPGIVNVVMKKVVKQKEKIDTIIVSFSDILNTPMDNMLPFNFKTVVDEIEDPALIWEDGKHSFIKWGSKTLHIDFPFWYGSDDLYITNHDEQYSLPLNFKDKGIQNFYFVMKHSKPFLQLVQNLKNFWFLHTEKINIKGVDISPFEFSDTIMKPFLPQNFTSDDRELLYIRIDDVVISIINHSVNGTAAGIMNTGIGASLIAQYVATHDWLTWTFHPEVVVDEEWMIAELKKRDFEIWIGEERE